ncbi:MAG: hypothetical protein NT078_01025 [Candidatus Azambacteria bacterium]|nr:hypothetical protein [Candidatus Azambacteria bacterium]
MEKWEERDARRNKIIEDAVNAADRIILVGSNDSVKETDYLTAEVARKFMEKALHPFSRDILKKDIEKK